MLLFVERVTGNRRDLDSRGLQVAELINTARLPGDEQWGAGKISSSPGSWHATRMEPLPVRPRHQLFLLTSLPFCARERAQLHQASARGTTGGEKKQKKTQMERASQRENPPLFVKFCFFPRRRLQVTGILFLFCFICRIQRRL